MALRKKAVGRSAAADNRSEPFAISTRLKGFTLRIERGLPVSTLEKVAAQLGVEEGTARRLARISSTTLARRRVQGQFSPEESDRLYRLRRIANRTVEFFGGDEAAARRWLARPARAFGGSRPLDLLINDAGVQEVDALLGRLEHGVFP